MWKSHLTGLVAVLFAAFLLSTTHTATAQVRVDGGEIVKKGEGVTAISVSGDEALAQRARRAFNLHGAYNVVGEDRGAFDFRFRAGTGGDVVLAIHSRGQLLYSETVTGGTPEQNLLRAADLAVLKTTGKPGFFSGRLALVSRATGHREIYLSDILFERVQRLTDDRSNAILPNFSPDGRKLLYTSYHRQGFPDLYLVDLASGKRQVFASYRGTNTGGQFSPDSRNVAMILSSPGNPELFIGRADKSTAPRRLTRNDDVESGPTWSPDGSALLFVSDRLGGPQIYRISARGGAAQLIATRISGYCTEPDWNPANPDQFVYTARARDGFQLALHSFDTGKSVLLTSGPAEASEPLWLNDGRHVVYTRLDTNGRHLAILDTETGATARLTPDGLQPATQADFAYRESL